MKTKIINGIEVQVIENEQDMLQYIKLVPITFNKDPITFNIKCNDKIITSVNGFDSC